MEDKLDTILKNLVAFANEDAYKAIRDPLLELIKEARLDELHRATNAHIDFLENKAWFSKYFDKRLEELKGDK